MWHRCSGGWGALSGIWPETVRHGWPVRWGPGVIWWQARSVEAVDVLARELHRWDTGFWSRYDLFPHRVANVANPFYHRLHIDLLRAMRVLAPRAQFDVMIDRFETYGRSSRNARRAYAHKFLFRVLSPRRATLRRVLPWATTLHP